MKVTPRDIKGSTAGTEILNATGQAKKLESKTPAGLDKAGSTQTTASGEKVHLSQRVLDMQKIKELATPTDTVDEAKVARLQKLIDEGKYKVDADAIADRLVDDHLNLPS